MAAGGLANTVELFETELRWFGVVYDEHCRVARLSFFNDSRHDAEVSVQEFLTSNYREIFKVSPLRTMLLKYSTGKEICFDAVELVPCRTDFQEAVRRACRDVQYGQTATYGQLAVKIRSPKAARAVGLCMKNNPIPIIVPCHRVIGSRNRLVGFSAGKGISSKSELLRMEGSARKFVN
tara:strand:- start:382 stop:918 length:537 start_codon:yes stop_codon:yes gene_type:complete